MADGIEHIIHRFGWAPGYYYQRCTVCLEGFTGEKRSLSCRPCASEAALDYLAEMSEATNGK